MDTKQNHLPYSRGTEQSRAALVGHQIPVPQVQQLLSTEETGKGHIHNLL